MALNVYSLERDGEKSLSKNFKVKEFRCKDGSDPIFIDSELVEILQKVRDHFGSPVIINSAYRTAAYNLSKKVGGAKFSQHQYGKAADIYIQGILITKLAEYVETLMPNKGGIGIYHMRESEKRRFTPDSEPEYIRHHRRWVFGPSKCALTFSYLF